MDALNIALKVFFLIGLIQKCLSSCSESQGDFFIIRSILENLLTNDCKTIATLGGIFFENREKPPNSVRVKYVIQIPDSVQCRHQCPCWNDMCAAHCDPGHCCIEREFLWGRIPMYVQDSIFRHLSMCSLVVGGLKEIATTIFFNVSQDNNNVLNAGLDCTAGSNFPCSWCNKGPILQGNVADSKLGLDTAVLIAQSRTPLDKALLSLTAKLQGYAAKAERLDWLMYDSELAIGYSEPYNDSFQVIARMIMFLTYFSFFQMIIFMLVYKYRYRIFNKICQYIDSNSINKSLFWSLILTTILAFACVLVIALLAGGICMSVLQIVMLSISLAFGLPHMFVVCFRMQKSSHNLIVAQSNKSMSLFLNKVVQKILFSYIYILPHIIFFWLINYFVSFIARPFSYLLLLVYLCVSSVFIWVANAIGIHLLFPLSCDRKGNSCRRQIFAISLMTACNCLNFSTWSFIEVYFYDRRAHAASFMTILPGMVFTLLGWYLSGDLVKLFDMLVVTALPKPSRNSTVLVTEGTLADGSSNDEAVAIINGDDDDTEEVPRKRYTFKRLKWMMRIMKRPTSVVAWTSEQHSDYDDIDEIGSD